MRTRRIDCWLRTCTKISRCNSERPLPEWVASARLCRARRAWTRDSQASPSGVSTDQTRQGTRPVSPELTRPLVLLQTHRSGPASSQVRRASTQVAKANRSRTGVILATEAWVRVKATEYLHGGRRVPASSPVRLHVIALRACGRTTATRGRSRAPRPESQRPTP